MRKLKITKTNENIFDIMKKKNRKEYFYINPVNTKGVMGKGLAKQFKDEVPNHFDLYKIACQTNQLRIGRVFIDSNNKIIDFPTKDHWKGKSKKIYIEEGLKDLHRQMIEKNIKNIIMPKIGSGLGGLDFYKEVLPLIKKEFSDSTDVEKVVISVWGE